MTGIVLMLLGACVGFVWGFDFGYRKGKNAMKKIIAHHSSRPFFDVIKDIDKIIKRIGSSKIRF